MANVRTTPIATKEAVEQYIHALSYEEMHQLLVSFLDANGLGGANKKKYASIIALQELMISKNIQKACPHCGSISYVRCGTQASGLICFKCKDCGKKFNVLTGTILEKTRWQWELWVKVLEMTINNESILDMVNILEKDFGCQGISFKTVWHWRMKLIHVLAMLPQPKLNGVIQIDETYVRECQKGSRELINYLPQKYAVRLPRYGYKPSLLGIMGPEFCNVVTAVDERGYCVCKVLAMGKLTDEVFYDYFDSHIEDPTYICTDGCNVYANYCDLKNYRHYIKPSNYDKILDANGYIRPSPLTGALTEDDIKQNKRIKKALYKQGEIDGIVPGRYSYEEFDFIKKGNHLSLGKVNELHKDIKKFLYEDRKNVSSKYLQDYIGFFTYIRNWKVKHGSFPSSNADAMEIFFEILVQHSNYTKNELKSTILLLPRPTGKYISLLRENTKKMRKETSNKYFKFNEYDDKLTFDRRAFLTSQPRSKLHEICRNNNIRGYSNWPVRSIVVTILKLPNIDTLIAQLLTKDRTVLIEKEDIKAQQSAKYCH